MKKDTTGQVGEIIRVPEQYIQTGVNHLSCAEETFAKEREYILCSTAFRRMSAKTQVFNSGTSDHLRTRLTHTLEVSQIARNIAAALGLDCNLTEAIALAHDLGHTPFGHVGERCLHEFSLGTDKRYYTKTGEKVSVPEDLKGFKHNMQSMRVLVDYIPGCEFTNFLLYGVRAHSGRRYKQYKGEDGEVPFYKRYETLCSIKDGGKLVPAWSFEAFVVRWADEIAQRHHDIEDALYQGIMSPLQIQKQLKVMEKVIPCEEIRNKFTDLQKAAEDNVEKELYLHYLGEFLLSLYTECSIEAYKECIRKFLEQNEISSREEYIEKYLELKEEDVIECMQIKDSAIVLADGNLGTALKYAILDSFEVQRMDGRSQYIVRRLIRAYKTNAQQLPNKYINRLFRVELKRCLNKEDYECVFQTIQDKLGYREEKVDRWQEYEYRHALSLLQDNSSLAVLTLPVLMRMVFDCISMMTDSYAYREYKQLYE